MKKTNKIVLSLSLLLLSSSAFANPYITGQAGAFGYGKNNPVKNIFDNDDDIRATARIGGGYQWDMNNCLKLGAEAGFNGFQDIKDRDYPLAQAKLSRWSVDALAVADYLVTSDIDLFAKAGPAYVHQKASVNLLGNEFSHTHSAIVPKAVIGVGYNVADNVNVNLSLNHEFKRDNQDSIFDALPATTSAMVGVKFNFA